MLNYLNIEKNLKFLDSINMYSLVTDEDSYLLYAISDVDNVTDNAIILSLDKIANELETKYPDFIQTIGRSSGKWAVYINNKMFTSSHLFTQTAKDYLEDFVRLINLYAPIKLNKVN